MDRPLSDGERKAFTDILVTLIGERTAAIGTLSEQLAEVREEHARLKLLYVWVTGISARDAEGTEGAQS
jgi:hypothetical protein